ncbi:hypothetical protein Goklo_029330 [Gossypium klotzschianum]|uniref:Uncharacterized protein n=1 Tax=Gossypium klotzschianum TaxID=34286 RepID=A0A7J8WDL0_9ROSI|nr:hypothetical protein [Gossypium klotzschianum]
MKSSASFISSQLIRQIKIHGKIKAQGSFQLNAKRVLARVQKIPSQQLLFEMMWERSY